MMLKFLALIANIVCPVMLWAQVNHIHGTVWDKQSGEPVSFAHVSLGEDITMTNESGVFILPFDQVPEGKINVTCMGYHPSIVSFDSHKSEYTIGIDRYDMILEEPMGGVGDSIMFQVFSRFITNYEQSPKKTRSYYKERLTIEDELCYLAEGVLDIYLPLTVSGKEVKVVPVKMRKKLANEELAKEITLIKGHAFDMAKSSIWRSDSFLDAQAFLVGESDYRYKYAGQKLVGDKDVFIIRVTPKSKKGYVTGVLYVEDETFVIRKMVYYPSPDRNSFWNNVKWTEEFEKRNGFYHMVSSTFEGKWSEEKGEFVFRAILANNEIKVTNEQPDDSNCLGKHDVFLHAASDNFADSFWEGYNFIELDDMERSF